MALPVLIRVLHCTGTGQTRRAASAAAARSCGVTGATSLSAAAAASPATSQPIRSMQRQTQHAHSHTQRHAPENLHIPGNG